jgi:branched-chain amino acid transport system substrate-binding protein
MTARIRQRRSKAALLSVALLMFVSACGSRLTHDEHVAANGGRDDAESAKDDDDTDTGDGDVIGVFVPGDGTTQDTTGTSTGTTGGVGTTGGPTATEPTGSGGPPPGGDAIRVGMIGNFGGIAGASFVTARESLKAWVGMINAKGGINGHKVELLVADDGGEGTRDLALAKDFIENRGAIALINYFGGAGGPEAVAAYAQSKGVPVIGGAAFDATFFRHPIMFPQIVGTKAAYHASAKEMADRGLNKVAIVYCTEGGVCKENANLFKAAAVANGMQVVYEAGVSLAQPDFTAECLAARGAGANAFYPQVDGGSVNRLARSCSRQGFKPGYFLTAPVDPPDPILEGSFTTTRTFPWFIESGSPALEEYGAAMKRFAPNTVRNGFTTFGWMSGKLLEVAAAKVSTHPTAQEILEGLWAIKNETFGGISPAMSFVKGQPAPEANCGYYLEIKGGKWTAPKGMELTSCL